MHLRSRLGSAASVHMLSHSATKGGVRRSAVNVSVEVTRKRCRQTAEYGYPHVYKLHAWASADGVQEAHLPPTQASQALPFSLPDTTRVCNPQNKILRTPMVTCNLDKTHHEEAAEVHAGDPVGCQ